MDLLAGLKEVFLFNRENYSFDRAIELNRVYQIQKMRIEQVDLYREDLRDLFELTIVKMDSYLLVSSLTLSFAMGFYYEGRLPEECPAWLMWLWGMSMSSAIVMLVLSVWFAIHASVTAQTFAARLLTQWLRLPFPSLSDVHDSAPRLEDFERGGLREMLRLPVVGRFLTDLGGSEKKIPGFSVSGVAAESQEVRNLLASEYTHFVDHFFIFRKLQDHWASFDAYARVTLVIGSLNLLFTVSYMALAHFVLSLEQIGGLVFPAGMAVFACIHVSHNLVLSGGELIAFCLLVVCPIILSCSMAVVQLLDHSTDFVAWLSPLVFAFHGIIALVWLKLADGALPTRFVTVVSIDVLGEDVEESSMHKVREKTVVELIPADPQLSQSLKRGSTYVFDGADVTPKVDIQRRQSIGLQAALNVNRRIQGAVIPAQSFKIASACIVLLWTASVVWSIWPAAGISLWGWQNFSDSSDRQAILDSRYSEI